MSFMSMKGTGASNLERETERKRERMKKEMNKKENEIPEFFLILFLILILFCDPEGIRTPIIRAEI